MPDYSDRDMALIDLMSSTLVRSPREYERLLAIADEETPRLSAVWGSMRRAFNTIRTTYSREQVHLAIGRVGCKKAQASLEWHFKVIRGEEPRAAEEASQPPAVVRAKRTPSRVRTRKKPVIAAPVVAPQPVGKPRKGFSLWTRLFMTDMYDDV